MYVCVCMCVCVQYTVCVYTAYSAACLHSAHCVSIQCTLCVYTVHTVCKCTLCVYTAHQTLTYDNACQCRRPRARPQAFQSEAHCRGDRFRGRPRAAWRSPRAPLLYAGWPRGSGHPVRKPATFRHARGFCESRFGAGDAGRCGGRKRRRRRRRRRRVCDGGAYARACRWDGFWRV